MLQDWSIERVGSQGSHHVDVRVIAATNRSLRSMVDGGRFRADLDHRLAGVEKMHAPPLRARRDDIPLLVSHFAAGYRRTRLLSLTAPALEALMAYDWPGNVRQLARALERAVALAPGPAVTVTDLPGAIPSDSRDSSLREVPARDDSLRAWSSRYVRLVLERCDGNKRRACQILDITYHTLQSHLDYGFAARERPRRAGTCRYQRAGCRRDSAVRGDVVRRPVPRVGCGHNVKSPTAG